MFKKRGVHREKGFFAKNKALMASTTLVGTIVGAGILGIPYVVSQVGILYGFLLVVILGSALLMLNLFAGEVVLRTKEQHQLTGYAEKYLGKNGKRFMALSMFITIYGALIAYLIGGGATIHAIFKFGTPLLYTLIFFAITFFIVYKGIKATGRAELILISLLLLIVILIGFFSLNNISISNFAHKNIALFFLPYGVILFALMGVPAIPEMQEVLGKHKKKFKKAIIAGSLTPVLLYIIFTVIIVGIVGFENFSLLAPNDRIATIALSVYSLPVLGIFANILAVLAMFTSFLTLAIALVEMYDFDYEIPRRWALLLTFIVPLIIVLLNLTSFIVVLGITGAVGGGLEAILVISMYWRSKKLGDRKPEYSLRPHKFLGILLIVIFAIGMIYQFISGLF